MPERGPPLPGDLGPAIVASQQPVVPTYAPPSQDPEDTLRKESESAAASSVFFHVGKQGQAAAAASGEGARRSRPCRPPSSTRWRLARCRRPHNWSIRESCRASRTRSGLPEVRVYGNSQQG